MKIEVPWEHECHKPKFIFLVRLGSEIKHNRTLTQFFGLVVFDYRTNQSHSFDYKVQLPKGSIISNVGLCVVGNLLHFKFIILDNKL